MTDNLDALRLDAAKRGKWNMGFFAAGAVFWLSATVIGVTVDLSQARILWIAGTFLILPVAVLFSRVFGADPFTKGNALGELVGFTHMSVIAMTFPIILASAIFLPQALLLVMAIAYCLDFYVMSWAFGTRLFGVHAAVRVVTVSLIWFTVPQWRMSVLPAVVAVMYVGTVLVIPPLRRRWLSLNDR